MTITCQYCSRELSSVIADPVQALAELNEKLLRHVSKRHEVSHRTEIATLQKRTMDVFAMVTTLTAFSEMANIPETKENESLIATLDAMEDKLVEWFDEMFGEDEEESDEVEAVSPDEDAVSTSDNPEDVDV